VARATRSKTKSTGRGKPKAKAKASRSGSNDRADAGRVIATAVLLFAAVGLAAAVLGLLPGSRSTNETATDADTVVATDAAATDSAGADAATGTNVAGTEASTGAQPSADQAESAGPDLGGLDEVPPTLGAYQELTDLDGWINSEASGLSSYDGQVRIVKFWTFGCINCKNTLPHLREIYSRWQPQGLEIIGVHSPEFDHERDPVAVQQATVDQNIPWPVALDTEKTNFRSWQGSRRFWPRTYVIDRTGQIRYDHIGEGRYRELEATVAYLIKNPGA